MNLSTLRLMPSPFPFETDWDAEKLGEILKAKEKEYDKAEGSEEIERLVSEIEMLKFVLFLVCRNESSKREQTDHDGT